MTNNNDWIEWVGGECPVPESALVDVKTNGGGEYKNKEARSLCWRHAFINGNIIAYRIIPKRATNQNGEQ